MDFLPVKVACEFVLCVYIIQCSAEVYYCICILYFYSMLQHSEERWMFSATSVCLFVCVCVCVCLFVCQHDNFRTSKHKMLKLAGRCIVQKSLQVRIWGHNPLDAHPQNVALGYDIRKISTCYLVVFYCHSCQINVYSAVLH